MPNIKSAFINLQQSVNQIQKLHFSNLRFKQLKERVDVRSLANISIIIDYVRLVVGIEVDKVRFGTRYVQPDVYI